MSAKLNRDFILDNPDRWNAAKSFIESNWEPMFNADTPLHLIVSNQEENRRAIQNKFYWSVVVRSIASQAWIEGRQFSADAWHEQLARMFGICVEVRLPNGEMIVKRLSTTEMKVREFSQYIEECMAYAGTELGIKFPSGVD